jgi:mono/diheme cytochrome c family protein
LAQSTKLNRTSTQIQNAISSVGQMSSLGSLTSTEVQAIADALAGGGTTPTPTPTTGEQLYISMCQSCHGFNGTGGSAKAIVGVGANQITNAVAGIGAMQNITLTGTNAQDIANFLSSGGGTQPAPTTGEEIYAIKCAACHGPGGRGGSEEAVTGVTVRQIQSAIQNVSEMRSIPLTNGEAQALESYLSGGTGEGGYSGYGGYEGHDGRGGDD